MYFDHFHPSSLLSSHFPSKSLFYFCLFFNVSLSLRVACVVDWDPAMLPPTQPYAGRTYPFRLAPHTPLAKRPVPLLTPPSLTVIRREHTKYQNSGLSRKGHPDFLSEVSLE